MLRHASFLSGLGLAHGRTGGITRLTRAEHSFTVVSAPREKNPIDIPTIFKRLVCGVPVVGPGI